MRPRAAGMFFPRGSGIVFFGISHEKRGNNLKDIPKMQKLPFFPGQRLDKLRKKYYYQKVRKK